MDSAATSAISDTTAVNSIAPSATQANSISNAHRIHDRTTSARHDTSAATPFRFRPDPLLPCLRELERTMHGPSGVEPPAPATVFFELAQPILAAETGREHRLRGKRSCQRENGAKPRNISIEKEGKMVTLLLFPRSFVSAFFSLSLSRFQK